MELYRTHMAERRQVHGLLVCLEEGLKVTSDGIIDPRDTVGHSKQKIKIKKGEN